MTSMEHTLGNLRLSDEHIDTDKQEEKPPTHVDGTLYKPASLMGLSDELLSIICNYAMIHPSKPPTSTLTPNVPTNGVFDFPSGVISSNINDQLRLLLRPFRSHPRLYRIARHEFLSSNLAVLNLADLKASAIGLLPASISPRNAVMLLNSLVHIQCHVSVSDLRAPFTQRFNQHHVDVLNMDRECEQLRIMPGLCWNLKTVHFFLKVDEWYLMPSGPDIRRGSGREKPLTEREVRYRGRAETVVELARSLPYANVTVAFHHWRRDGQVRDMREIGTVEVVEAILGATVAETWEADIVRVK